MTAESELEDGVELRSALIVVRSAEIAVEWNACVRFARLCDALRNVGRTGHAYPSANGALLSVQCIAYNASVVDITHW